MHEKFQGGVVNFKKNNILNRGVQFLSGKSPLSAKSNIIACEC